MGEIRCTGYTPKEWQKAVHKQLNDAKGTGKVIVVKSKRQCGKSLMAANELLRYALNYQGTTNAIIEPTLNQSRKVFKDITKALGNSPIVEKKNESLLEIEFINGSSIIFKSAQQRDALRGITISGILIIDEAAYMDVDVLELVLAWTNVHRSPILMLSTPRLKSGFFYDYFLNGQFGDNEKIISIDWCDYDTSEFLDNATLEMYRKMLPAGQFRTEFLGEFIDEGGGVFTPDPGVWYDYPILQPNGKIYVGLDFANGDRGDYTALTGFDDDGRMVLLEYRNDQTPLTQIDWITKRLTPIKDKIEVVIAEKNSMGKVYIDMLKDRNPGMNITEFVTDNTKKREIIDALAAALGQGNIKILNNKELKKEVAAYQMEITKGGAITYNGAAGINDDLVMSMAFALYGRKKNIGNKYCISY